VCVCVRLRQYVSQCVLISLNGPSVAVASVCVCLSLSESVCLSLFVVQV